MKGGTRVFFLFTLSLLIGCSDHEKVAPKNNPPIAEIQIIQNADKFTLSGSLSADPDGNSLTYKWSTSSDKITITSATAATAFFSIPVSSQSFNADVTLEVSDGKLTTHSTQTILVPSLNLMESYGLGHEFTMGVSNNTDYNWYLDQGNSGTYASVNCGPTSVTMAIKWVNESFSRTPLNARQTYRSSGGWWYTSDIINYLNDNSVSSYTISLTDINLLKTKIDVGSIVILCLDMYYVNAETNSDYHVDKFYSANATGWGHFIVIKGYKVIDNYTFFEAYDPFDFDVSYSDHSLKGKDRYYRAADLDNATNNWWDFAIVVTKAAFNGGRMASDPNAVDPTTIQHKSGQ